MLKKFMQLWNERFAPRDWRVFADAEARTFRARRWSNGAWEYREATDEEHSKSVSWFANAP